MKNVFNIHTFVVSLFPEIQTHSGNKKKKKSNSAASKLKTIRVSPPNKMHYPPSIISAAH